MNKTNILTLGAALVAALTCAGAIWMAVRETPAAVEADNSKSERVESKVVDSLELAPVEFPGQAVGNANGDAQIEIDDPGDYVFPDLPEFPRYEPYVDPGTPFSGPPPVNAGSRKSPVAPEAQQGPISIGEFQESPKQELFPGGWEKAAKDFNAYLTGEFLPDEIRKWENQRPVPRDIVGVTPILIWSTKTERSGTSRTYYLVESFTKEGEFQVRKAEHPPGHGLVLGRVEKLDFEKAEIDDWSMESLFTYHSRTRNDDDGNKMLAGFAAWLYKNGAVWGGNRALSLLSRRAPASAPMVEAFVRERHKFPAEAELKSVSLPGYLGWEELLPDSMVEERKKAREQACKDAIEVLRWRIEQTLTTGERSTMDALFKDFVAPRRGPAPVGLSVPQIEVEIQAVEQFCRNSSDWAADAEAYEAVKDERRKDREKKATLHYWLAEAKTRSAPISDLAKSIRDIMADADGKRRGGIAMRDEGQGDQKIKEAYGRYNDAAEELRKLIPTKSSPRGAPMDPYNGYYWSQLAECLRYACEPARNLDQCNDEAKAREAIVAATIALRYFPGSVNMRIHRAVCYMLVKNFKDARTEFEEIEKDPKVPGSTRANAKQYIEQIDRIEKKELRERALKGMGKN